MIENIGSVSMPYKLVRCNAAGGEADPGAVAGDEADPESLGEVHRIYQKNRQKKLKKCDGRRDQMIYQISSGRTLPKHVRKYNDQMVKGYR